MTNKYQLSFHHVTVDGEGITLPESALWRDLAYNGQSVLVAIEERQE